MTSMKNGRQSSGADGDGIMFDELIRELGRLDGTHEIPVSIASDADGYLDRAAHHAGQLGLVRQVPERRFISPVVERGENLLSETQRRRTSAGSRWIASILTRTLYWFQHEPCWFVRKKNAPWYGKPIGNSQTPLNARMSCMSIFSASL